MNQHLPPGIGYYPTGRWCVRHLPFPSAAVPRAGQPLPRCPRHSGIPGAGRTEDGVLPGQQHRLQPPRIGLPLPFGSERRSGRRRDDQWGSLRRFLLRAQCHVSRRMTSAQPPRPVRRARPASPTSLTALRTRFSMQKNMPAASTRPWRRRSGTAARRGRTARSPLFPWLPPPMKLPPRAFQPGFAIAALAARGAPDAIGPGSMFQVRPTRTGQLRSDPGLDGSRRRHPSRPGRRQRPHAGPRHESHDLVGRRHSKGRRSAGRRW